MTHHPLPAEVQRLSQDLNICLLVYLLPSFIYVWSKTLFETLGYRPDNFGAETKNFEIFEIMVDLT